MRLPFRSTRLPALALVTAVVPAAVLAGGGQSAATAATVTAASTTAVTTTATATARTVVSAPEIPDSPAGRQLTWFFDALSRTPIAEDELREHFTESFLTAVPADEINKFAGTLKGLTLESLTTVKPTALQGTATLGEQRFLLAISVDDAGKINGLQLPPAPGPVPPFPKSWGELDTRLRQVAPNVGFLAAEIDGGRCRVVHGVNENRPQPLGSIFKLYVLGAVAEKIRDGELRWNTKLTIRPEWKSPSEGGLWERPDNSTTTVREAAKLMISISDNTATDLLIHTVGRAAVEAKVRQWSDHAKQNIPFLTTREFFLLKGVNHPQQARTYLALGTAKKRAYLKNVVAKQALTDIRQGTEPREIGTIEWFGSPRDVCRAYVGLGGLYSRQLDDALSGADGLDLDRKKWPTVWFKGGSELGVLSLGYLGRSASGRTYVVTSLTNDPKKALDESTVVPQLISLTKGAFSLVRAR
ncbi:serine hydrolase [Streptosporangium sp. NPDC051022]|uniref:serine hydrolase n=1 Tax=Streptosporangium sp. NPDC051022 TaxID=3155752 RepID=UPI00342E9B29